MRRRSESPSGVERTRERGGLTLVEVVVVLGLFATLVMVMGGLFANTLRVAARERAMAEMDSEAARVLEQLRRVLRPAYIPVALMPLESGRKDKISTTDLERNATRWQSVLRNGTDLVAYLTAVDLEGDGDVMYGSSKESKRLMLGLETPLEIIAATDASDTMSDLGIVDLNPLTDLQLPNNNSQDIQLTDNRFADTFVYPAVGGGRSQYYGVIRFVPYRENGQPVTVSEASPGASPGLAPFDFNDDGDETDVFALGRIELVFPRSDGTGVVTQSLSSDCVLLQLNRNDTPQESLFQLWPPDTGENTLKIHLLLCNYLTQRGSWSFSSGGYQFITRSYDSLVKLQLMVVD